MKPSTYPLVDAEEAARTVLEHTPVLPSEQLPLGECMGRAAAADVLSQVALPPWPASAVDGYAIRAADGGGRLEVVGESAAGHPFSAELPPRAAARILTGGVLPSGADSVVMVEDSSEQDGHVRVPEGFPAGRNFHEAGADLRPGEIVIRKGDRLGPAELGLAAAMNMTHLVVGRQVRVALMSTGDELRELGEEVGPGQIVDSNRYALLAALREAGAEVEMLGIAPDEPRRLRALVEEALARANVLVTSGGVSVGTHDLVKPLLEDLGEVHIGRVKLRPGKPFTFATLPRGGRRGGRASPGRGTGGSPPASSDRLAFGLPGFPVSSLVTFEVFVRPALLKMQGFSRLQRPALPVRLGYDARAAGDRTEYQRVRLTRDGEALVAHTTGSQSSSRLLSLAGAQALVRIPPGEAGIAAGTTVEAMILDLR